MIDNRADKAREAERYNFFSAGLLSSARWDALPVGHNTVPEYLRDPYLRFELEVVHGIRTFGPGPRVLELCAGTGNFTSIAVRAGAVVTASDIAGSALAVLMERYRGSGNLSVTVADIECTGFENESFDLIMCAGGLSYGDNGLVLSEIARILKPGGRFVCVDSLNHNPIYRLNRYLHFIRGNRTASTLRRMPTIHLIENYRAMFGSVAVWYFGCVSWSMPILSSIVGEAKAASFSRLVDGWVGVRRSAFKFVMTARKARKVEQPPFSPDRAVLNRS